MSLHCGFLFFLNCWVCQIRLWSVAKTPEGDPLFSKALNCSDSHLHTCGTDHIPLGVVTGVDVPGDKG